MGQWFEPCKWDDYKCQFSVSASTLCCSMCCMVSGSIEWTRLYKLGGPLPVFVQMCSSCTGSLNHGVQLGVHHSTCFLGDRVCHDRLPKGFSNSVYLHVAEQPNVAGLVMAPQNTNMHAPKTRGKSLLLLFCPPSALKVRATLHTCIK